MSITLRRLSLQHCLVSFVFVQWSSSVLVVAMVVDVSIILLIIF